MPKAKKLKTALSILQQRKQIQDKLTGSSHPPPKVARTPRPPPSPPYSAEDQILLIGEGNFSFARSLVESVLHTAAGITATSLDSEEVACKKYADANENAEAVREAGGIVLFEVDGTKLDKCKQLKGRRFDKVVFNFPHTGAGIKDQQRNVHANQLLVSGFLASATPYLNSRMLHSDAQDGEIHITVKSGEPYDSWDIRKLVRATGQLAVRQTVSFLTLQYPGYEHRRTLGFKDGVSQEGNAELVGKRPKTVIIVRKEVVEEIARAKDAMLTKTKGRREKGRVKGSKGGGR